MRALTLVLAASAVFLGGCASAPPAAEALPWRDDAFAGAAVEQASAASLFALDGELLERLRAAPTKGTSPRQRLKLLMDAVFDGDRRRLAYAAGQTTPAAQTWLQGRGDCLSLTLLTYAAAQVLGLPAVMQEVRVPAIHGRQAGLAYVSHHVNLLVPLGQADLGPNISLRAEDAVIDFEPQMAGAVRGMPLGPEGVLARYHNNLGVQALARGDWSAAHAWLRAAARDQPDYAPTYTNLGALYAKRGLTAEAERWLRHAVAIASQPEHALRALEQLLAGQGRSREAAEVAQRLQAWQRTDPYYWIAEGVRHLEEGRPGAAVRALERAQDMTTGFGEVHRHLALAYWQVGQSGRAEQQLELLAQLGSSQQAVSAKLRRKLRSDAAP